QAPGRVSFQQRTMPVRELTVDLVLQKNAALIRSVKLTLRDSTIAVSGKLDNLKDPRYDFKADTDLALGSLAEFAGVPQRVNRTVHAALTATGPVSQLVATARLDGQNITVERFDKLSFKAETTYDVAAQRVQLASFNVFSSAGTMQG